MASTLINVALSSIRPAHSSYYGDIDENNPVVCASEKEIKSVLSFFSKKTTSSTKTETEACSRGSNWLFEIWNKYEPRLPSELFYSKLISVGDYLYENGFYDVALRQCYRRYIQTKHGNIPSECAPDARLYFKTFFDIQESEQDRVLTAKALLGLYMCEQKSLLQMDPCLQMSDTLEKLQKLLHGLRMLMQCLFSFESLFWILYNCTIIMYETCRALMTSGNSIKAIEFLLWAAITMESSVPLLGVNYLSWRTTLYSAVCLAYYDSKAGHHAETFARRALGKLQELSELERLSESVESVETQCAFRQAAVKMASMIFKRSVYESRRKPKGMLRPKQKNHLKDAAQLTWPRTVTERLLSEMFEGGAAQFLAVLEALSSTQRRTLLTGPSSTDSDMNDVTSELFFAGKEIVAGGGGNAGSVASAADHSVLAGIRHDKSLIELAAAGQDGVTLISVVRFIKLAFCYEQWTTFNTLLDCALIYIKKAGEGMAQQGAAEHSGTELCLAMLLVMERIVHSRSQRRLLMTTSASLMPSAGDEPSESAIPPGTQGSSRSVHINDDLVNLAETVFYCISEPTLFAPQGLDHDVLINRDMIVDASLLLWQKCKAAFGKVYSGSKSDLTIALQRTESPGKWIHVLSIVHASLLWAGMGEVDPELIAEITLRLALMLESLASPDAANLSEEVGNASRLSVYSTAQSSPTAYLSGALQVVKDGMDAISRGRSNMASCDARLVADITWMGKAEQLPENAISASESLNRDLQVELLTVQHRVALKLMDSATTQGGTRLKSNHSNRTTSSVRAAEAPAITEVNLKSNVGGSLVSKAILMMLKADRLDPGDAKAETLLEKAVKTLRNAQEEEKRLFEDSWGRLNRSVKDEEYSPLPPPPILMFRSNSTMIFKPAHFQPDSAKVAWYRIFGRLAAGPNVKVRLNDYYLPGTGEEVPAGVDCQLKVEGLKANQRYVFAVAAYTKDGKLIGGSIGTTGISIVASLPLSILATWGFVAQIGYKLGAKDVADQACKVLWNHFVAPQSDPLSDSWSSSSRRDFSLTMYHLDHDVALQSSPVLLRHALTSVFVGVETAVRDKNLYCDKLCYDGPLLPSQIDRLRECERLLVAIEIAQWLNDTLHLMQAAVQTYGLVAPIMQAGIETVPMLQVTSTCQTALREVNQILKLKKSTSLTESLHHMVAVLSHYIAKVAKSRGKHQAALVAIEAGKHLLRFKSGSFSLTKADAEEEQQLPSAGRRGRSRKQVVPKVISNEELAALEERLADITRENRMAGELTGIEEPAVVLSRLSVMKPIVAFRELAKFRRRARYLEFFVFILKKALRTQQTAIAMEWAREVLSTLHRRSESFMINRAVVSKQPGGVAVQGDESRKYAAAVVEYSQDAKKKKPKKFKRSSTTKGQGRDFRNELELRALSTLERLFVDHYRNSVKRKKYRKVNADDMPWRAEFNHMVGLLYYDVFLEKMNLRNQIQGLKTPFSETADFLDQEWWSYDVCGAIVVGWNEFSRLPEASYSQYSTDTMRALERAAHLSITTSLVAEPMPATQPAHAPTPEDEHPRGVTETPRTQRTTSPASVLSAHTLDSEAAAVQAPVLIETLKNAMLSFRRGLVLAHRGHRWTLLQNISRSLHSCLLAALKSVSDAADPALTIANIRAVVWRPVAMAADFLLDMLVFMQDRCDDVVWPVESVAGDYTNAKGGVSLKFEDLVDDMNQADVMHVKRIFFTAVQMLHYETRWECLIDLCLRFSALTHDRFSDVITPVMAHAQYRLRERVRSYGGEKHPQSHFVPAVQSIGKKTVENRDYLRHQLLLTFSEEVEPVGVGGHIDPLAHDVYQSGRRALALSSVPFDPKHSIEQLRQVMSKSQYTSRALQHSRRLYTLYLASRHNPQSKSRKPSANARRAESASSCVEFSSKHEEPQPTGPPDITLCDFNSTDALETLAAAQLSTVIESYNRTIELLVSHKLRDLVAQASHELGDLYFHQGNVRAARRWWTRALDQAMKCKNSLHDWRKTVKDVESVPARLLEICGLWGCLLALSISCKIGELTVVNVNAKTDCALLGAELVRAIFRSSLPHPTADFDYATYEIIPATAETSFQTDMRRSRSSMPKGRCPGNDLVSGIDIFSDRFRCNLQTLIGALHWLCDTLVSLKFSLVALPPLTFYQYLATFVCRDAQRSAQCRSMKLSALCELRLFGEATTEALNLLYGVRLPHRSAVAYASLENPVPSVNFIARKPVEDTENLKAMEVLASKRLSPTLSALYGPHLTCEVTLGQARLLTCLAGSILRLPQKPTPQDLQFVSPDFLAESRSREPSIVAKTATPGSHVHAADDSRSVFSAFSSTSASKYVNKLFTKRDRPVGQQLLKGMLLAVAEHLTSVVTKSLESSQERLTPSEVYFLVTGHCLLSEIYQQRQLSTISAAQALSALKVLQNSSLFDEIPSQTGRKLRSSLRKSRLSDDTEKREFDANPHSVTLYPIMERIYRSRLNARLWLDCRLRMCQALASQVKGLGKVGSGTPESTALLDHSQAQLYCAEGLAESEACDDVEMQALFLIQGSTLDGISVEESMHMLEDASSSLDDQAELSHRAVLGLVECTTLFADLSLMAGTASAEESVISYKSAHSVLLLKAMQSGETISHRDGGSELSTVSQPPRNLFASYPHLLACIKLRIAHASLQTLPSDAIGDEHRAVALLLEQALVLSSQGANNESILVAEIQLLLGKVQRLLIPTGLSWIKSAQSNLRETIRLSEAHMSDLSLVRKAHLEKALVDIVAIEAKYSETALPLSELEGAISPRSESAGNFRIASPKRSFSLNVGVVSQPLEVSQGKLHIVASLFAAFQAAKNLQHRSVLPGNPEVTTVTFADEDKSSMPDFVFLDLTSDHTSLPWDAIGPNDLTVDPLLAAIRSNANDITWVHALMYYVLLQRKSHLTSAIAGSNGLDDDQRTTASDDSEGMFEQGGRATTVRIPLNSTDILLRVATLHEYLAAKLPSYSSTCHFTQYPANTKFVTVQWYQGTSGANSATLLWCVYRTESADVDCGRIEVSSRDLKNLSQQVISLTKRTDEFFGRALTQAEPVSPRKKRSQRASMNIQIDSQLEEDWKHILNQITNLLSVSEEPISQLPFDISVNLAHSMVDLFSIGCHVEGKHPMHKWLVQLLSPV